MVEILGEGLTYDDVLLVPQMASALPRDVVTRTQFCRGVTLQVPIVSAAMDTVTESRMAVALAQQGGIFDWYWLPLLPLFVVYIISGVAETNRAPFDVAEGESEIVAGFHVEYSGAAFAMFFLGEYANMILIAALTAVMFLGGWESLFAGWTFLDGTALAFLTEPGLGWFALKTSFFLFCFLWFRATFPRYRYDQIMRLGWKVFIPITIVWLAVEGAAVVADIGPWFD